MGCGSGPAPPAGPFVGNPVWKCAWRRLRSRWNGWFKNGHPDPGVSLRERTARGRPVRPSSGRRGFPLPTNVQLATDVDGRAIVGVGVINRSTDVGDALAMEEQVT